MAWTAISTRNETPPIVRGGWLDALRFIVASLIILHHFQGAGPIVLAEGLHPVFERGGFLLTNFFLIDSGYVLMRVYGGSVAGGRMSAGDFFAKRFLRVWPAHIIMGLSLVALVVGGTAIGVGPRAPEWFAWDQLPAQLGLVQAFGIPGGYGWNAPSWSISALIGCYLAFPWILKGLVRLGPWSVLALGVGLYLVANQLTWSLLGYPVYQMPMGYGFIRALPLFLLGMALAWFAQKVWIAPKLAGWAGIGAALMLAFVQYFDKHALISLVCISTIILAAGAVPTLRPSKWVEKAAQVSFSMFITNEVVRIAWFGVANVAIAKFALPVAAQWALWGLGVMAAFVFAFLFHILIDTPIQDRIRAWLKGRSRSQTRVATQPVVSLEG
ncbi:MAG: acyltransferase [Alphaproteobacteria bacterium]|uniref:acyltransferase family protein n=1 Tax=Brevundimonas sp. TaxID=1871086 RepID=UPI00182567EB|nr:acyltransferase [Brevundimonas sp.]MBA3048463.1 acyltransferase [Brevundimonas sp.]MBU3973747.1 acyltransferase [Alphaproteobacteria bacterium]MBU4041114.1 acyltransferase [Alphaproteobacteria bacterium]